MRRALAMTACAAALAAAGPAAAAAPAAPGATAAAAPAVTTMVAGKAGVLRDARTVRPRATRARVGGRRCAIAARTPLAALARLGLRVRLRDYGACGGRARDASGLFVRALGSERNRGQDGWVYKVGRRVGTAGAADATGPFGSGRLRRGARVLWFWCEMQRSGGCQNTLEAVPDRAAAAPGEAIRVTVRGYDDQGRGVAVAGATVALGAASALTGPDGVATVPAPAPGRHAVTASAPGLVRSFPAEVLVR